MYYQLYFIDRERHAISGFEGEEQQFCTEQFHFHAASINFRTLFCLVPLHMNHKLSLLNTPHAKDCYVIYAVSFVLSQK